MSESTTIVKSFRSFGGATVYVLADGRAVSHGITGRMLLDGVGGRFVRYLADDEIPAATGRKGR